MGNSIRKQIRAIAMLAVAAALVVGGVAAAQGNSGPQGGPPQGSQGPGPQPGGPPPLGGGPMMKNLTYAEFHVQKDGEAVVIRLDQGKITAVDSDSITLSENDGSEVTIPVDGDIEVKGKPGEETSLDDLEVGQQVSVCGPSGGPAQSVMLAPPKPPVKG
jgi:hypothetical protein